jgi:hypothetical protein
MHLPVCSVPPTTYAPVCRAAIAWVPVRRQRSHQSTTNGQWRSTMPQGMPGSDAWKQADRGQRRRCWLHHYRMDCRRRPSATKSWQQQQVPTTVQTGKGGGATTHGALGLKGFPSRSPSCIWHAACGIPTPPKHRINPGPCPRSQTSTRLALLAAAAAAFQGQPQQHALRTQA